VKTLFFLGLVILVIIVVFNIHEEKKSLKESAAMEKVIEKTRPDLFLKTPVKASPSTKEKTGVPNSDLQSTDEKVLIPEPNQRKVASVPESNEEMPNIPNQYRRHLAPGIDIAVLNYNEYAALVGKVPKDIEAGSKFIVTYVLSQYPDEPTVAFSTLNSSCPALEGLGYKVAFRIGADGRVINAAPLNSDDGGVPPEVYQCQFGGGPSQPFVTTYHPPNS
jgi:hypothetical protein